MQSSQHISSYELYRIINSGFSLDNQQQVNWEDWKDNLLKLSMPLPIMSKVNYYAHVNSVLREFTIHRYLTQSHNLLYFGISGRGRNGLEVEREQCVLLMNKEYFLNHALITVELANIFLQYVRQI